METFFAVIGIGVFVYLTTQRFDRKIQRTKRQFRGTTKRAYPRKSPSHYQPSAQSRKPARDRSTKSPENWETPEGRRLRHSQRRVTSGIEHDPPPPIPASRKIVGKAWVIDGDTIAINRIKIRLAGIDAPELDQPWGQKSKWAMIKLCKGQTIHVELTGDTSYDRLVGTCYLPDGTDVGAELVRAGLALDGSYFSRGKYLHLEPDGARQRLESYGLGQKWR